jgi:hypothetical protein
MTVCSVLFLLSFRSVSDTFVSLIARDAKYQRTQDYWYSFSLHTLLIALQNFGVCKQRRVHVMNVLTIVFFCPAQTRLKGVPAWQPYFEWSSHIISVSLWFVTKCRLWKSVITSCVQVAFFPWLYSPWRTLAASHIGGFLRYLYIW